MKRRLAAALAALPLVSAALVGVTSSPAQAGCGHWWANKDADYGYTNWSDPEPKFRTGPHDYCDLVYWLPGGSKVYYHCYTVNEAGNTWTHARLAGTDIQGWVWDGYLNDGGSYVRC